MTPDEIAAVMELRQALADAQAAVGGFIWLGNNLDNAGTPLFRELYEAALGDARTAYEKAERLLGKGPQ